MPINASPHYFNAEKEYLSAQTTDQKIKALKKMITLSPKHKGSENLLKGLRTRLKKLKYSKEKAQKIKKTGKKGIRKEGFQCALIGLTNSGKSSILSKITNKTPAIASYQYTTKFPEIGTMHYDGIKTQIVDLPSIGSEDFDKNIANTADCLIIVITSISDLEKIKPHLEKAVGKKITIINKSDTLSPTEKRKLEATIKSKRINGALVSAEKEDNLETLKQKIFKLMNIIRIYTKEPGKPKANDPIVLPVGSTLKDVAEEIRKGFSKEIKFTTLTGPSSKFPNQRVGLTHVLKDKDIVEFHLK